MPRGAAFRCPWRAIYRPARAFIGLPAGVEMDCFLCRQNGRDELDEAQKVPQPLCVAKVLMGQLPGLLQPAKVRYKHVVVPEVRINTLRGLSKLVNMPATQR